MPTLTTCPECAAPAEVLDVFNLRSTEGPLAHAKLLCAVGHHRTVLGSAIAGLSRVQAHPVRRLDWG
jgi:hypothetical protein